MGEHECSAIGVKKQQGFWLHRRCLRQNAETAGLQDVLIYTLKGLSVRNLAAMKKGGGDPDAGGFIGRCLFATLTNVNFDPARFEAAIREAARIRDALPPAGDPEPAACTWTPESPEAIAAKAGDHRRPGERGPDLSRSANSSSMGSKGRRLLHLPKSSATRMRGHDLPAGGPRRHAETSPLMRWSATSQCGEVVASRLLDREPRYLRDARSRRSAPRQARPGILSPATTSKTRRPP